MADSCGYARPALQAEGGLQPLVLPDAPANRSPAAVAAEQREPAPTKRVAQRGGLPHPAAGRQQQEVRQQGADLDGAACFWPPAAGAAAAGGGIPRCAAAGARAAAAAAITCCAAAAAAIFGRTARAAACICAAACTCAAAAAQLIVAAQQLVCDHHDLHQV